MGASLFRSRPSPGTELSSSHLCGAGWEGQLGARLVGAHVECAPTPLPPHLRAACSRSRDQPHNGCAPLSAPMPVNCMHAAAARTHARMHHTCLVPSLHHSSPSSEGKCMSTADHHKHTLPPQLHPKVRQAGHMSHPQAPLLLCTQPLLGNVRLADSQRDIGVASLCVCVCEKGGLCA